MLPYYIVFLLLGVGVVLEQKLKDEDLKNKLFIMEIVMLILFFGLRNDIGVDWPVYYQDFRTASLENLLNRGFFEIGFYIYTYLLKLIFNSFNMYMFVGSLIDFVLLYIIGKKYSKYPIAMLLLFYGCYGFALEINLFRTVKSLLIFTLSIKYIYERDIKKFLILNMIGFLFHASTLLYIPMYFILNKNWNKKLVLFILVLANISYFSETKILVYLFKHIELVFPTDIGRIIGEKLLGYAKSSNYITKVNFNIVYLAKISIFLLFYFISDEIKNKKFGNLLLNSLYLATYIWLLGEGTDSLGVRLEIMFEYSYWLLLPFLFEIFSKSLILILVLLFSFVGLDSFLNNPGVTGSYIEYKYKTIFSSKTEF